MARLAGVIAAVATATDGSGAPDTARSVALARFLLDHGCDGLNVLGTTGEATSYSVSQRQAVMNAYKAAGLPLDRMMVGTGAAATADAVALTRHAAELGFGGALVLPPFYYKGVPDDGLAAYVATILAASAQQPTPLYLYHYPQLAGVPWSPALIRRLLSCPPRSHRRPQRFVRRYGVRKGSRRDRSGVQGLSVNGGGAAAGPRRHLRWLHLGDGEPQCRFVRARLSRRRYGGS